MTVHLRLSVGKPPEDLKKAVEFVGRVGAGNLRLAPSTSFLLAKKVELKEASTLLKGQVGLWLVNAPQIDITGQVWNGNGPIGGYQDGRSLTKILAIAPEAPLVFDVLYKSHDEEYLNAKSLTETCRPGG